MSLLGEGADADAVVGTLTARDEGREHRQLGVVDGTGRAATFTGESCFEWAGGWVGDGFCCQGNILTDSGVVSAMADAFQSTEGELAARLLAALEAGDAAGGDSRGRQSAALLVVREAGGYDGGNDIAVDLRVDDHPLPIPELRRIFSVHRMLMPRPEDLEFLGLTPEVVQELRLLLGVSDGDGYDPELKEALRRFVGTENLEERWTDEDVIERGVLEHLRSLRGA